MTATSIQTQIVIVWVISLTGCSDNFVQLPDVPNAQSWLLQLSNNQVRLFDSREAATANLTPNTQLHALPLSVVALGIRNGEVSLGVGRPVPSLESFTYRNSKWVRSGAAILRMEFDPSECAGQCIVEHESGALACGACAALEVQSPEEPTRDCPPNWISKDEPDGHHVCEMDLPEGIDRSCPDNMRWSMATGECVGFTLCDEPFIEDPANAIYVDPLAQEGGNGGRDRPFTKVDDLNAGSTVVLMPGTHEPFEINATNVRVIGFGSCSVVDGGEDTAVSVTASGSVVQQVRLQSSGITVSVALSATASIADSQLEGRVALEADGRVWMYRSLAIGNTPCEDQGSCQSVIKVRSASELNRLDVIGDSAISAGGEASVSQVRLLSTSEVARDSRGLSVYGPLATIRGAAVIGFATGASISGDSITNIFDALLVAGCPSERLFCGQIGLSVTEGLGRLRLSRVDIRSEQVGINGGDAIAYDLRISARATAIRTSSFETNAVNVTRTWIDYVASGIRAESVTVNNGWLRRVVVSPTDSVPSFVSAAISGSEKLNGHHINITDHDIAISGFKEIAVDDLSVQAYEGVAVAGPTAPGPGEVSQLRGNRWNFDGAGTAIEGSSVSLNVRHLAVRASAEASPLCLRADVIGGLDQFSLTAPLAPAIKLFDAEALDGDDSSLSFIGGRYAAPQLIAVAMTCSERGEPIKTWPRFDNVMSQ